MARVTYVNATTGSERISRTSEAFYQYLGRGPDTLQTRNTTYTCRTFHAPTVVLLSRQYY
jgi:hypothetical protein